MDNIDQSNALIAIYAGAEYDEGFDDFSFKDDPGFKKPNRIRCTHVFAAKELLYHASADWLLPVVKKLINELATTISNNCGFKHHLACINSELLFCYKDITPLYEDVIEAIKFINDIKKYNSLTDTV